ncbi:MAG TPA: carboxypeptidase-like regulatory domain-containing protein [Solirubrobacterales bacterium]|nr:carboxypeptidase-like regulatory domain-containing protein [Solirubrobacterales bacterium]
MKAVRRMVLVAVVVSLTAVAPAAAQAATITGTVSGEDTHAGIAGVEVCPTPQPYTFEAACATTDSSGHYSLNGLRPAQYSLAFSGWVNNVPYVSEVYDNKPAYTYGDLVTLSSPDEVRQLDVELARGGSVGGKLTDEETGLPIAGMAACARLEGDDGYERCAKSDDNGNYQVNGLPSGEYSVYYEGWNQVNYLREFYEDAELWAQATRIQVTAPGTTGGVDAELARGAQIFGHVSQAGTGLPLPEAFVCAEQEAPGENQECDMTDAEGNYALIGLPAGRYLVAFELEYLPTGHYARQWWQGAATAEEATPIVLMPPETRTGIDGVVDRAIWGPPEIEPTSVTDSAPLPAVASIVKPPLRKCHKGFHRKLVKGKKRCVRKHWPHRKHHRSQR